MEESAERARANDTPPVLTGSLDSLKRLLEIEERRLEIAVAIEKKRDIVFPETTVIIHDIMKIQAAIDKLTGGGEEQKKKTSTDIPDPIFDAFPCDF